MVLSLMVSPTPLLPENRASTIEVVVRHQADAGIAWDGDLDRCFFFDEKGDFIEGYYICRAFGRCHATTLSRFQHYS